MEILFLSHRIPYPPDKGDKIRAHAIVTHLAARHKVHLACFLDDPADFQHTDTVRRMVQGECRFVPLSRKFALARGLIGSLRGRPITTGYFGSSEIDSWLKKILRDRPIARAVVFGSAMAPYMLRQPGFDLNRSILDLVDVDSDKWQQYAATMSWPKNWIYRREAKALGALERKAARQFGATLLVSPYEARTFAYMAPEIASKIHSVSNGVDLARFNPTIPFARPFPSRDPIICMTGAMDYWPNAEGAKWFCEEVMPLLLRELPGVKFYIVGSNPSAGVIALQTSHIIVTGRVEDVRPYLAHADVAVAPLRIARGVQNKVLEAMAMGKPVVATQQATRALAVESGAELWIENDPSRFAGAILEAIVGSKRAAIAANGRAYVERSHNWSKILTAFDDLLDAPKHSGKAPIHVVPSGDFARNSAVGAKNPCI